MRTILLPKRVTETAPDAVELTEFITFPLEEVRSRFRAYLIENVGKQENLDKACKETFLIWEELGPDEFWSAALEVQIGWDDAFVGQSLCKRTGAAPKTMIRHFSDRLFWFRSFIREKTTYLNYTDKVHEYRTTLPFPVKKPNRKDAVPPSPTAEIVARYLKDWEADAARRDAEEALLRLCQTVLPFNSDLNDILIKAAAVNDDDYKSLSRLYPMAQHIQSLAIDDRLRAGDPSVVTDLCAAAEKTGFPNNIYPFASKYCHYHNPDAYPVQDVFLSKLLFHFRDKDRFAYYSAAELREDYTKYCRMIADFRSFYGLEGFSLSDIHKYLTLLYRDFG